MVRNNIKQYGDVSQRVKIRGVIALRRAKRQVTGIRFQESKGPVN
jgi:hypothetical protein